MFTIVKRCLGNKIAVVTDNDGDKKKYCIDKYSEFVGASNIKVFFEKDETKRTFEIVLYHDNKLLCDALFVGTAIDYMLNNKTEAAYKLLSQNKTINVPQYIQEAIKWIKE